MTEGDEVDHRIAGPATNIAREAEVEQPPSRGGAANPPETMKSGALVKRPRERNTLKNRLFGNLLEGTLKKAKVDEEKAQSSVYTQRRNELLTKQSTEKAEVNQVTAIQRLEMEYQDRISRRKRSSFMLQTTTQPKVLYKPKQLCDITRAALDRRRIEFDQFKTQQYEELAVEKHKLQSISEKSENGRR